jgi:hypothetical protein
MANAGVIDPVTKDSVVALMEGGKPAVALEPLKGQRTAYEIGSTHSVSVPIDSTNYKSKRSSRTLRSSRTDAPGNYPADEELRDRVCQELGQLKLELDWLKNNSGLLLLQ